MQAAPSYQAVDNQGARKGLPRSAAIAIAVVAVVVALVLSGVFGRFGTQQGDGASGSAASGGAVQQGGVQNDSGQASNANGGAAGGAGAKQSNAQQAAQPAEYTYDTVVLEQGDQTANTARNQNAFSYVQFSNPASSKMIESMNYNLKSDAERALERKMTNEIYNNRNAAGSEPYYMGHTNTVTYFQDGMACVLVSWYEIFPGGVHGMPLEKSLIADFNAEKQLSAAEASGVSERELRVMAWRAADAFLRRHNDLNKSAAEAFKGSSESEGIPEDAATFYLVPEGVVAHFAPYVLGSFAFGAHDLLVCDSNGSSVATGEDYAQPSFEPSGTMKSSDSNGSSVSTSSATSVGK